MSQFPLPVAGSSNWKPIIGYGIGYEVSNDGQVRNAQGRVLKPFKNSKGYLLVTLGRSNKNIRVHRLVASAFIRDPLPSEQVNHIDFDKANNRDSNLEWCTCVENVRHYSHHRKLAVVE